MSLQRPISSDQKFQELVERTKRQEANMRALRESVTLQKKSDENKAVLESQYLAADEEVAKDLALEGLMEPARKERIKRAAMEAMNRIKPDGMRILTNKVLFELVYESLWVDDVVKQQEVRPMYECYLDTVGFLQKSYPRAFQVPKNKLTVAIESAIKETVDTAYNRINAVFEEAMRKDECDEELLDKLRFNMTTDEEAELDEKIADMGKDQIVNLVKKKVLSVVQDEKKRGEKRAELFDELDEAAKDEKEEDEDTEDSDDDSPDAVSEEPEEEEEGAETSMDEGDNPDNAEDESSETEEEVDESYIPVEEMLKSKSFWGKKMKNKKNKKKDEKKEGIEKFNPFKKRTVEKSNAAFESLVNRTRLQEINRIGATSVFEGLTMFNRQVARIEIEESETPVSEAMMPEMIASAAMMQTLMQYTTMETFNTIQYCNLTRGDLNAMRMLLNRSASSAAVADNSCTIPTLSAQV